MSQEFFDMCNIYHQKRLPSRAHGGLGEISFKRLLSKSDIQGACNFMDYTVMPPGTTVGRHTHGGKEEEYYLILTGQGQMELGDRTFEVKSGDLVRNPPGGTHSLTNIGENELHMFVFELQAFHNADIEI